MDKIVKTKQSYSTTRKKIRNNNNTVLKSAIKKYSSKKRKKTVRFTAPKYVYESSPSPSPSTKLAEQLEIERLKNRTVKFKDPSL